MIELLFRRFAILVQQIIREGIEGNAIRECRAKVQATQDLMQIYAGNPKASGGLLDIMLNNPSEAFRRLRDLGVAAVPSLTDATLTLTAVLLERYHLDQAPNTRKLLLDNLELALTTLKQRHQELVTNTARRFSEIRDKQWSTSHFLSAQSPSSEALEAYAVRELPGRIDPGQRIRYEYHAAVWYELDGNVRRSESFSYDSKGNLDARIPNSINAMIPFRANDVNEFTAGLVSKIMVPALGLTEALKQKIAPLLQ
jgi:hypothetical protein